MELQNFTNTLQTCLAAFEKFWLARHAETPDAFPLALSGFSEWQDEFLIWLSTEKS